MRCRVFPRAILQLWAGRHSGCGYGWALEYGPDREKTRRLHSLAKLGLQPETKLRQIGADCHARDHLSNDCPWCFARPKMAAYAAAASREWPGMTS